MLGRRQQEDEATRKTLTCRARQKGTILGDEFRGSCRAG
jgi:hypothetical protein